LARCLSGAMSIIKMNNFQKKSLIAIVILLILVIFWVKPSQERIPKELSEHKIIDDDYLDFISRNLAGGGPSKDGIPSIDNPQYVSVLEADKFLDDNSIVYGVDYNGFVAAYPQKIMYWHEIVNDEINGEKISVTYCPLTGSTIGYKNKNLGVSGKLYNSNLVMYDRETDSLIPQIIGVAIDGSLKGQKLESFHVFQTKWIDWKAKHPNTKVLSLETGNDRNYDKNPYPGYDDILRLWFPVATESNQFKTKELMIGIELNNNYYSIPKNQIKEFSVEQINFSIDKKLNTLVADKPVKYFDVYWFAWYAYHPNTKIIK